MKITNPDVDKNIDLRDISICKKKGGTIDDTEIIEGLVFSDVKPSRKAGGPTRM
jgi:T-complex protein 1 subunit delta